MSGILSLNIFSMKKLIFRKFVYDVLIYFCISILITSFVVWTLQAINYFDYVTQDGHGLKIYFFYTLLNFPKIIYRILPFVFFISLFFTIVRYETNNELNIFWTIGISKIKFTNTLIIFSLILMLFQIFLSSYLAPLSQNKARNIIKNSNIDFFTNLINEGKFINVVSGLTIFIDKKEDGKFTNIFIDDSSKGFTRMIYSKNGTLVNDNKNKKFLLFEGSVVNIKDNKTNTFRFDQINFGLQSYSSNSITIPKVQETDTITLLNCIFNQSKNNISKNCDMNSVDEIKQELSKRLFKPTYIPLIALTCCFLLISGKFDINYKKIKIKIFAIIIFILLISEISLRYSSISNIFLTLNFLLPFILFIFFYLYSSLKIKNA
jgi:lipopolysaccharide export system permease protein